MTRQRLQQYVRTKRLTAGLSQAELGALLGYSESFVQKCETGQRVFAARFVIGCAIVFGEPLHALFPALVRDMQEEIGRNAATFDERLRGRTDARARKQLALLSAITKHTIPDL
jgi:transcriptional regulator with XRE-family HTH domain